MIFPGVPIVVSLILLLLILLISLSFLALLYWRLWFCRKPKRSIPADPDAIVAPANGTVAVVRRFDVSRSRTVKAKKWNRGSVEFLAADVARKGWFLLIVMTPLNVHYQRAPVAGRVLSTTYSEGRFLNAVSGAEKLLTLENERNEILIDAGKRGKVKIVQIAGMLARRIRCDVRRKQKTEKGEVIGFIDVGSQVALLLPDTAEILARPGDTTFDGETVVARWRTH